MVLCLVPLGLVEVLLCQWSNCSHLVVLVILVSIMADIVLEGVFLTHVGFVPEEVSI